MTSLDLPLAGKHKPLSERQGEESAIGKRPTGGDIDNEDLLAPARGAVNGVLLSLIIWGLNSEMFFRIRAENLGPSAARGLVFLGTPNFRLWPFADTPRGESERPLQH